MKFVSKDCTTSYPPEQPIPPLPPTPTKKINQYNNIIMFPLLKCPNQNPILLTQKALIANLTQSSQETYFEMQQLI